MLGAQSLAQAERRVREAVRQKHELEQQIVRIQSLPANAGRKNSIRHLRKQLAKHR
jgi:hypothetical protein